MVSCQQSLWDQTFTVRGGLRWPVVRAGVDILFLFWISQAEYSTTQDFPIPFTLKQSDKQRFIVSAPCNFQQAGISISLTYSVKILRYIFYEVKGGCKPIISNLVTMPHLHMAQSILIISLSNSDRSRREVHLFGDLPEVDGTFAVQHERRAVLIHGKTIIFHFLTWSSPPGMFRGNKCGETP